MKKKQSNKRGEDKKKVHEIVSTWLDSWSQAFATRCKPAPLIKRWSREEPEAILDYLHGDTPADEAAAACYYEYARASEIFRKARREYDPANFEESLNRIIDNFPAFRDWRTLEILICPDYPKLPWRELNEAQRKNILLHFVKTRPTPLITDAWMLNARHIFDRLKQQAEDAAHELRKGVLPVGHCPAMVGGDVIKHVVITINYKEGIDAVKKSFSNWLSNEVNEKFFKDNKKPVLRQNPDSPDHYKELLKFLAAWRLYDELDFKAAGDWTRKNRRQDKDAGDAIRLKPFFWEKRSKGLNVSPLYKERRHWEGARRAAQQFLAQVIECGGMV